MHRTALVAALVLVPAFTVAGGVLQVGPDGTHTSIQAAIDDALAAGGESEIRVAIGAWLEALTVPREMVSGAIAISGGWLPGFEVRSSDPSLTVVDPGGGRDGVDVRMQGGSLTLEGLTFTNGSHGIDVDTGGTAAIRVANCRLVGNRDEGDGYRSGAGMRSYVSDSGSITLTDLVVADNLTDAHDSTSNGAGLTLGVRGQGRIALERVLVLDNAGRSGGNQVTGVGIYLSLSDEATGRMVDTTVARNLAHPAPGHGVIGAGGALWIRNAATLTVARTAWLGNGPTTDDYTEQLSLLASNSSVMRFSDSVVAAPTGAHAGGIVAYQRDIATLDMTNCTVADHPHTGVAGDREQGQLSLANSIVFGNGSDLWLPDDVAPIASVIGVDPLFVDPAHLDLRLQSGSPAIGAGTGAPPGGLTDSDLMGVRRGRGGAVDAGAHVFRPPTSRIAVVTHAAGFGGTPWRSDLAWTNPTPAPIPVTLTLSRAGTRQSITTTAAAGATATSRDLLVELFGVAAGTSRSGSLEIVTGSPAVAWASRTYADPGAGGTYGQSLPALAPSDLLAAGEIGIVPMARSDAGYYTNLGFVNGTGASCRVRVALRSAGGASFGTAREVTIPAWEWLQLNDVFPLLGAGEASDAAASVEVLTAGGAMWAYASIVDRITKDPTTVAIQRATPAGVSLRLAAVVHVAGIGGTPWRTAFAAAAAGAHDAHLTLVYRSDAETRLASATVPAGGTAAWDDLLIEVFGLDPDGSSAGSLEVISDQPLAAFGRAYADRGSAGTYGQALPALAVGRDGLTSLAPGLLTGLRRDAVGYTNIGFLNLGAASTEVRITLFDAAGAVTGAPLTRTLAAGAWLQVNDVLTAAGAPSSAQAAATIEVVTPDGRVWAYASVIDRASRDPTTVPVARVWAVGPGVA